MIRIQGLTIILLVLLAEVGTSAQDTIEIPKPTYRIVGINEVSTAVAWSPNGEMLAFGGSEYLWLYSIDGDEIARFEMNVDQILAITWSPDSNYVVASGVFPDYLDGTISVWQVNTNEQIASFDEHTIAANSLDWHPTETLVASGDMGNNIFFWQPLTGEIIDNIRIKRPEDAFNGIYNICWLFDRIHLLTIAYHGVEIVDTNEMKAISLGVPLSRGLMSIHSKAGCSPHGNTFALNEGKIIDAKTGEILVSADRIGGLFFATKWNPVYNMIATSTLDEGTYIWDSVSGETLVLLELNKLEDQYQGLAGFSDSIAWHPNGEWLAQATSENTVRIWDLSPLIDHPLD